MKKQMKFVNVLEKFKLQTKYCKICFEKIEDNEPLHFLKNNGVLCVKCQEKLKPKFISFKTLDVPCLAIYDYDDNIKNYLYQFKGCFDYELKDVFLYRYISELRLVYRNHILIPIPSYISHDIDRGFNHVVEMFKILGLEMRCILEKTADEKQSDKSKNKRKEIYKYLKVKEGSDIKNKKVVIVDDVYTTGSTIKSAIKILTKQNPKSIEVLVMSKAITKSL